MSRKLIVLFLCLLADFRCFAQASVTSPYPALQVTGTSAMGSFFEEKFGDQLAGCDPSGKRTLTARSGWWIFGKDQQITAIPQNVLAAVQSKGILQQQVLPEIAQSAASVFAYVFSNKQFPASLPAYTVSYYLDVNKLSDPNLMLPDGMSSIIYTGSCSGTVALAMQAHSAWTWPIASLSTSLAADYKGSAASQVGITYGTFKSPMGQYMSSPNPKWRAYSDLLFWEWYDAQGTALRASATPGYVLSQFSGASAYQIEDSSTSKDGEVDASVVLSAAPGALQSNGSVKYSSNSTLHVTNYGVVIDSPIPDTDWTAIPTLDSLRSLPVSASLDPKSTDYKLLAGDMRHTQLIPGVPADWCNSDNWHIINHHVSTTGTLNVVPNGTSVITDPKGEDPPTCAISIDFSSPAAGNKLTLSYILASSLDVNNDVNDDLGGASDSQSGTVLVKAAPVILSATGQPLVNPTTATGMYSVPVKTVTGGVTFYTFTWTGLSYPVVEDPADKIAGVTVSNLSVSCGGGSRQIGNIVVNPSYGSPTLSISMTHQENDSIEKLDVEGTPDVCVMSGNLAITLTSGAVVGRQIPNTTIYYPKPVNSSSISIASLSSASGKVGDTVVLTGAGFLGATSVTFSPAATAVYKIVSDSQISATIPPGANTGQITVTGPNGSAATATAFTITP